MTGSPAVAYCIHDLPEAACVDCRPGEPRPARRETARIVTFAKYEGICVTCYADIAVGDRIVNDGVEGWSHEECK